MKRGLRHRRLNRVLQNTLAVLLFLGVSALMSPGALSEDSQTSPWDCDKDENGAWQCTPKQWDWVEKSEFTPEQVAATPKWCKGTYFEPPLPTPERELSPEDSPLRASSDTVEGRDDYQEVHLIGNVQASRGYRHIHAGEMIYYRDHERIDFVSGIQLREPGLLLRGKTASVNPVTGEGTIDQASYVLHDKHARGDAQLITRDTEGIINVDEGSYTYCEPGNNSWLVRAREIELDTDEGVGTARGAKLQIRDKTIMRMPYLSFPLDDRRKTGLLFPTLSRSSNTGLDLTVPYYLNLAPNYDATLLPRYISNRGPMVGGEMRYLNNWGKWAVAGTYLFDDDKADRERWLINLEHRGKIGKRLESRITYTDVSGRMRSP